MTILQRFPGQEIFQPAFTGRVVFRLVETLSRQIVSWVKQGDSPRPFEGLSSLAAESEIRGLQDLALSLEGQGLSALPLIPPTDQADVLYLEESAGSYDSLPPVRTLLGYFVLFPNLDEPNFQAERMLARSIMEESEVAWSVLEPALWAPAPSPYGGTDKAVSDNELWEDQGYLEGLGFGINTRCDAVWKRYDGTGVAFADIETGWHFDHQDLLKPDGDRRDVSGGGINLYEVPIAELGEVTGSYLRWLSVNHGTKTLGVVVGRDHSGGTEGTGAGIVGIAPGAKAMVFSRAKSPEEQWDLVGAIKEATLALGFGGVLLIETQTVISSDTGLPEWIYPSDTPKACPVEVVDHWLDAIRLAVGNGIIVIEPAGNEGVNLDGVKSTWSGEFESGAIMVSGCHAEPTTDGIHLHFSTGDSPEVNYGSRVDCYAWGEKVFTSAYVVEAGVERADGYRDYSHSSAASAIIAGAAILVQQMYRDANGDQNLSPSRMRSILSKLENGTPVQTPDGVFKPMPDLEKVATALVGWPDVYIRDRVNDDGSVPNSMVFSSPDIIVRQPPVNVAAELGPSSPTADSLPPMDAVVPNQDNYVYVRLKNRANVPVEPAVVHVYWSEASPFVPPNVWRSVGSIDESQALQVPAGNQLVVGGPIVWNPSPTDLPLTGHGCLVALCGVPGIDAVPPLLPESDSPSWSEFLNYVGANNNVAWRNFTVADLESDGTAFGGVAVLVIQGVDEPDPVFDLEMSIRAPDGTEVEWAMPEDLFDTLCRGRWSLGPGRGTIYPRSGSASGEVAISISGYSELEFRDIRLQAHPHRCRLTVRTPDSGAGTAQVAFSQFYDGKKVGGLTHEWRVPSH